MSTTIPIRFEPPAPPVPRTRENRKAVADALRACPGQWALIGCHTNSGSARTGAYEIRKALRGDMFGPPGAFEAEAKTLFGEHRVYARYMGTGGA